MPEELLLLERVLEALAAKPGQKSVELATRLGVDKKLITKCLLYGLRGKVRQGDDYLWRLLSVEETSRPAPVPSRPAPVLEPDAEFSRLCRYYLECIGQDMDEGVSVFSRNQQGEPGYAQLPLLPQASQGASWWSERDVGRILGKVREDRAKLVAWLGYPVRLRQHRTARWEGFFVEPLLLWPIELPDVGGGTPEVNESMPCLNMKFLRSVAMGDSMQIADEAARLMEELGLNAPHDKWPDVDDMFERLVRIRPEWDWKETIDPSECVQEANLANLNSSGIYNRAIIVPGERSPFTQGLESELKALTQVMHVQLHNTALGLWLGDKVEASEEPDALPLIEVLPMNSEQRAAVRAALTAKHTVVTGPPGTGKSQVVTNLLVNAASRGMKVLFASKNNKAVDVVETRVNGLGNRPVLLRLGAKDYQTRLAGYLTQMLAGNPGKEDEHTYQEALERHQGLAARMAKLDAAQQHTLEARNAVDKLEFAAEDARAEFGEVFSRLDEDGVAKSRAAVPALDAANAAADRSLQGLFVRLGWPLFESRRQQALSIALDTARAAASELGLQTGVAASDPLVRLNASRKLVADWRHRLALSDKVIAYKLALAALQACSTFEEIARARHEVTRQVSENSSRLWRAWVQLAPTRLNAAQRKDVADYTAVLQLMTGPDASRIHGSVRARARELQSKVMAMFSCWAVTSLSARGRVPLEPGYFDLVVIDEASQCDIASALPLLYRAKRSVIIGDPMQLRHISALTRSRDSELQHKYGLVDTRVGWMYSVSSLFDVAAGVVDREHIVNLRDHHRSHADIISFSNVQFYEGRLRVATRHQQLKRPREQDPGILWTDVRGKVIRPREGGAQNREEAEALVDALMDLLVVRGYRGTVGVVTPFRAQAQLLTEMVKARRELDSLAEGCELLVDTVHKFQGDERDVMFFSPVVAEGMTTGAMGFLRSNGNLFNVAITRARGLLHVVGDRSAAESCGVDYLVSFVAYVSGLRGQRQVLALPNGEFGSDYPLVARPEQVSEWERVFYRALRGAGVRPIPQYSVEQYDLDFAIVSGDRRLNVEVDGERYHRSWTGELCMRDQLRNQRLIELGWEVKRFWVYEIRDDLAACVQHVAAWETFANKNVVEVGASGEAST